MSRNGSDGKMQVHRDGADARAEKLTVSVFIALGKVLALWLCCIVSQLHCHFNKEKVADGTMSIIWLQTVDMIADIYTKAVDAPTSKRLTPFITGFHNGFQEIFARTKVILEEKMNRKEVTNF